MNSTLKTTRSLPAFALALMMTLAMLGGINQLAVGEGASAAAMAQAAQASAPRA